jgi:thymidylate synthase
MTGGYIRMYISEFWAGVGFCIIAEVVLIITAAVITAFKGNMTVNVNNQRRKKMNYIEVNNATEAFNHWYKLLNEQNLKASSRDGGVKGEVLNAVTVIKDPTRGIVQSDIRKMPLRYAIGELMWYLSGNKNLSAIQNYTSAWDRMSDDGLTVNSNYGWCIKYKYGFDQWEYVKNLLLHDLNSRQAVLHIKTAEDKPSKDVNCTVCLQFLIREGKLHATVYMRSNDIWMGFPYDVFSFTALQCKMAMELGVGIGTYTHIAGSLHLYERNGSNEENTHKAV